MEADQRRAIQAAVSCGHVYDLAHELASTTPVSAGHPPFQLAMVQRHSDRSGPGVSGALELLSMGGHTGTHIDALCHAAYDGRLHGGIDASEACHGGRFNQLGVETITPIVCRGVLLDVPRATERSALDPGEAVTAADLERTCEAQLTDVGAGDALLIRTGWPVGRLESEELMHGTASGVPGPDLSAAEWMADRGVRVTGADTLAYEHLPPGRGHAELPVHVSLLVEHGIPIIELLDLEELADARVFDFLFVASPLNMVGATGSPLRPIAVDI
jgi:kynurenine formamidase